MTLKSGSNNLDVFNRTENILGQGENAGYSIFSFSHNVLKGLYPRIVVYQLQSSQLTIMMSFKEQKTFSEGFYLRVTKIPNCMLKT